jgi:forkhead box protein K
MARKVDSPDHSLEADALALLALKSSAPRVAQSTDWDSSQDAVPLARLEGRDFDYIMRKARVTIGRNSRLGDVDVNMGKSTFVSRRHVEILYSDGRFHLRCFGRNGVFINDVLHRDKTGARQLPKT